jgi:hypothetical protein
MSQAGWLSFAGSVLGGLAGVARQLSSSLCAFFHMWPMPGTSASKLGGIYTPRQRLADAFQHFAHGSRQYLGGG